MTAVTPRVFHRVSTHGSLSGLSQVHRARAPLPGPMWARLEVIACGICGTDLTNLAFAAGASLQPFGSFPAILGHEILGRVVEAGSEAGVTVGQRIAVDPVIGCEVRGYTGEEWCSCCANGWPALCERSGEHGVLQVDNELLAPGKVMGYHRQLPGGWGSEVLVHRSAMHPVLDSISDDEATLLEPMSVAMHAALANLDRLGHSVLVLGSGTIAQGFVWALRALGYSGKIVIQVKRRAAGELAMALGADRWVQPGDEAKSAVIALGAKAYKPSIGPEVFTGGFPSVVDCVGSAESMGQALRWTKERGHLVMLGCIGQTNSLDMTFLWAKELHVMGSVCYGRETFEGKPQHTFDVTQQLIERTRPPITRLISGHFALQDYKKALDALGSRTPQGQGKVVLRP
ncbi:MAG TPA: alcohol dehydrogenase catalytic domain-containing protein [Polyangium sp.]|nr:alcohol dehydrogenase catalytic domain-containing protein [Polyangium sp.]